MNRSLWRGALGVALFACCAVQASLRAQECNLEPPASPVNLLWIHHSTGGHWSQKYDPEYSRAWNDGVQGVLRPTWEYATRHDATDVGGNGEVALFNNNYILHHLSYGSTLADGENYTDYRNWLRTFRRYLDRDDAARYVDDVDGEDLLHCYSQNTSYDEQGSDEFTGEDVSAQSNRVIMFKSCFPNSAVSPADTSTGLAATPDRAAARAWVDGGGYDAWWSQGEAAGPINFIQAEYLALLDIFGEERYRDILFVAWVAPPETGSTAAEARQLADWFVNDWLDAYAYDNVMVFNFWNVLTGEHTEAGECHPAPQQQHNHDRYDPFTGARDTTQAGDPDFVDDLRMAFPAGGPGDSDSHPGHYGGAIATKEFIALLNDQWNRLHGAAPPAITGYPTDGRTGFFPLDASYSGDLPAGVTKGEIDGVDCLVFDGAADATIDLGAVDVVGTGGAFSWCLWYRPTDDSVAVGDYVTLLAKEGVFQVDHYSEDPTDSHINTLFGDEYAVPPDHWNNVVDNETWSHFAFVFDGATVRHFVDGVQIVETCQATRTMTDNANPLRIGDGNGAIDGGIREVAVYNRALTSAEVRAIFNANAAEAGTPTPTITPGGPTFTPTSTPTDTPTPTNTPTATNTPPPTVTPTPGDWPRPTIGPNAPDSVTIQLRERAGVARAGELATFGVPLPRDWDTTQTASLRLTDAGGEPLPAQFEVLERWGATSPDDAAAPVKWALVACRVDLPASGTLPVVLDAGGPGPEASPALSLDTATPGVLTVNTGAALFKLNTDDAFNLLEQATIDGRPLLQSLAPRQAILWQPDGGQSVVPGGDPDLTPRTTAVTVERSGPLYAVVRVEGSILDAAGGAPLDFTARLHFAADSPDVRLDFTVENNHPVLAGEWDQPLNVHNLGSPNSVYAGSLALSLRLSAAGASYGAMTEGGLAASDLAATSLTLYQDSSGLSTWDAYVGEVGWEGDEASAAPRLQAYCTTRGYEVRGVEGAPRTGDQALGWMSLADAEGAAWLAVAVRDFWQNFPKTLAAESNGTLTADLFPRGDRFHHNFRVGEEKTHSLLLLFGAGAHDANEIERRARAFHRPVAAVLPPEWFAVTGAIDETPPENIARWPLHERWARTALEHNPDFDPELHDPNYGNRTLVEVIRHYNFYGWQDYGDVPLDYESFGPNQAGQMNLKYWFLRGLFANYCRGGDPRWLDLALPAARHLSDIDILHIPDEGPSHWTHGAYFGHSQHDEPGNLNPNRNSNSPSNDLVFGVPGLLLAWRLTGEQRFHDVAIEALTGIEQMSVFTQYPPQPQESRIPRDRANMIMAFVEGCRATGDPHWRDQLRIVVGHLCDLDAKPWLHDPAGYGAEYPEDYIRMFMFDQTLWALGRYLDLVAERGEPDDLEAHRAIAALAGFAVDRMLVEFEPGHACHWYDYVFSGSDQAWNYLDVNNWALAMGDALAYAFKHTGDPRFLEAAGMFYATGVEYPIWRDPPPVRTYMGTKDLVNGLNWGLVYQNQVENRAALRSNWWMLY